MARKYAVTQSTRSLAPITRDDLAVSGISATGPKSFFAEHSRYSALADRIIAVTLCQGAALHHLDGRNRVKDFDVWTFYAAHPDTTYPLRRKVVRDFGDPKFRQSPDCPESALRAYLFEGCSSSTPHLARKGVVLIEPGACIGTVVWPVP